MNKKLFAVLALSSLTTPAAYAGTADQVPLDACVKAALSEHPGRIYSLRREIEDGKAQFELDIHGKDDKHWEVECDAKTGKVTETEREVEAGDPEFTSKAKVRVDAALKTALDKYPGTLKKIEYEIESEGVAYEFDIKTSDGKLLEVEVDAVSGELSDSVEEVLYQIGH